MIDYRAVIFQFYVILGVQVPISRRTIIPYLERSIPRFPVIHHSSNIGICPHDLLVSATNHCHPPRERPVFAGLFRFYRDSYSSPESRHTSQSPGATWEQIKNNFGIALMPGERRAATVRSPVIPPAAAGNLSAVVIPPSLRSRLALVWFAKIWTLFLSRSSTTLP